MERQAATSEVLSVISRSPGNLQPVFAKMLENAIRICERLPDCGRQCRSILLQDRRTEPPLCSPTCGRDKVAVTDPFGEKAPRYIIADRPMTEEEWAPQQTGGWSRVSFDRTLLRCRRRWQRTCKALGVDEDYRTNTVPG